MAGIVSTLKAHARLLHRKVIAGDLEAAARVRRLAELRDVGTGALRAGIRRRHCLAVVAQELGFLGWPHAAAVLRGAGSNDFGTLLYPPGAEVHWNIWSASYEEARAIREQHGGYLLAYRRHFFIADRYFIDTLGLDPEDPDWQLIGRDWARPTLAEARERLYEKLVRARMRDIPAS